MTFNVWGIFKKISTWVETQTDIFNVNMKPELFLYKPRCMYLSQSGLCVNLIDQNIWGKDTITERYWINQI